MHAGGGIKHIMKEYSLYQVEQIVPHACVLLVLYLARVRVFQAYVAWVEEASAMISSIGFTCNIAVFPSVHAYVKGY